MIKCTDINSKNLSTFFSYSQDAMQLIHIMYLAVTFYLKNVGRMKGIVIVMPIVKLVLHVELIIALLGVTSILKLIVVLK